jgi:hypothetical protein
VQNFLLIILKVMSHEIIISKIIAVGGAKGSSVAATIGVMGDI